MKLLKENLLLQFILLSVVAFIVLGLLLNLRLAQRLNDFVIRESIRDAQDIAESRLIGNVTLSDFEAPMSPQRYAAFDEFVRKYVVSPSTARVKLWNTHGTLVYSNDPVEAGQTYPIKEELGDALKGETAAEISVPQAAENERERFLGTLVEVYVPVKLAGTPEVVGAFEIYQFYAPIGEVINSVKRFASLITGLVFVALFLLLGAVVARGWQQIQKGQRLLNNRIKELQGLNNLFQTYLNQGQDVMARFRALRRQVEKAPPSIEAQLHLVLEIAKLDDELSQAYPPGSSTPEA